MLKHPIIVGCFGAAYGVQGWLRVHSETNPPAQILQYFPWHIALNEQWQPIEIAAKKILGDGLIVQPAQCTSKEQAKQYTRLMIGINKNCLPKLPEGEYYWHELIGLEVVTTTGQSLGIVQRLFNTGSNDIFEVQKERLRLIPHTQDAVIAIDLAKQQITVDWDPDF